MDKTDRVTVDRQRLLDKPRIYADLNGGHRDGGVYVVRLDSRATEGDLQKQGVHVREGLRLDFWADDGDEDGNPDPLLFKETLRLDSDLHQWVAVAAWDGFQPASEVRQAHETAEALT